MGNSESQQNLPLDKWSKDDVADGVATLGGAKYKEYAASIRESGIDGGLLASVQDTDELNAMLDELEISSVIHRKVITRALEKAQKSSLSVDQENSINEMPPSSVTVETTDTDEEPKASTSWVDVPDFLAAEQYDLSSFSSASEVEAFDEISKQIMESNPNANYAGVHMCLRDGQHILSGKIRGPGGKNVPMERGKVTEHERSFCSQLVMDKSKDFVVREVLEEFRAVGSTYVGHVIKDDKGCRLGAICQIITNSVQDSQQDESLRLLSAEIAAMTEKELRLREQLLERNKSLANQVENARKEYMALKKKQEQQGKPASEQRAPSTSNNPNSALLPFSADRLASETEREHIPPSVFENARLAGVAPPPVGKDDLERVARVEALGLHNIDPDGPMATQLRGMTERASSLFNFPVVTLTIHNHSTQFAIGGYDGDLEIFETMNVRSRDRKGKPFCMTDGRETSACNYTIVKRKTFSIPDLWEDEAFKNFRGPLRAYVGTPIISSDGYVVATLCMLDVEPRYDFTQSHELEFERVSLLVTQCIENWEHRRMMEKLVSERKLLESLSTSMSLRDSGKRDAPTGNVTIVLTDIQGSTALWEADAAAMKEALVHHDKILRKCVSNHCGYEIKTEGDAFHLAFHDPVDAIAFALEAQVELYKAQWSDSILALPDAAVDRDCLFCGPRVRMGIHHGKSTPQINEVSGRTSYSGETFRLAKSIEALCHGGQILASAETWRVVSELSEQLGNPQVVDYGEYVLMTGEFIHEGIIAKGVVQLVPKQLAFDYFHSSGSTGSLVSSPTKGRKFPHPDTKHRLTTSFLDAPDKNGTVTMMFVYPSGTHEFADELADRTFSILTKVVRSLLTEVTPPGYECQEDKGKWVIAFESLIPAVKFGLLLKMALDGAPFDDEVDTSNLVRIGIHSGAFSGMGPHPMTGRADYFGPVVNRAARVAAATDAGKVFVGVPVVDDEADRSPPDVGSQVSVEFVCAKELKGVSCRMALYCCEDQVKEGIKMWKRPGSSARIKRNTAKVAAPEAQSSGSLRSLLGSLRVRKGKKPAFVNP